VRQLCDELQGVVREAWSSIWVAGEVQRVRPHRNGHLYLELVEKGEGDAVTGSLSAVIWRGRLGRIRGRLQSADLELAEGVQVRCNGSLDFYPPHGRLQFIIEEIDPVFTEGRLEQRRRRTLQALVEAGLVDRNRGLALPLLPLRVGLVTSEGSAAYHDFLSTLTQSGYPFRVLFVHSLVQGAQAEGQIVGALQALGRKSLDCIAVVRGGGSRSDLSVFDARAVAEAVATCPLPVLTGLGHEIDVSIADRVAHTCLKTPTGVGEFLVRRIGDAEARLRTMASRLVLRSEQRLRTEHQRLQRAAQTIRTVAHRVAGGRARVERISDAMRRLARARLRDAARRVGESRRRLSQRALIRLERGRTAPARTAEAVARTARSRLAESQARLDGWDRLVLRLSPERTLARGFSVTRSSSGEVLRDAARAAAGTRIETQLYRGRLSSRVEET
jgi:exodeoxyribonuclease VII large subunit